MRKVYGLLSVQLTITTLIGAVCLFTPGVKELVQVCNPFLTYHTYQTLFFFIGQLMGSTSSIPSFHWAPDCPSCQEEGDPYQPDPPRYLHSCRGLHCW